MSGYPSAEGSGLEFPLLLTAKQKARELGVSVEFVRDHREELGVITFGSGPRPRLLFPRGLPSSCLANKRSTTGSGPEKTPRNEPFGSAGDTDGSHWRPIEP